MNQQTLKIDDSVIKALSIREIRRLICETDKGKLELCIRKGENNYFLTLDSVPLEADVNKELMTILFPKKEAEVPQVYKYNNAPILLSQKDWESIKSFVSDKITRGQFMEDGKRVNKDLKTTSPVTGTILEVTYPTGNPLSTEKPNVKIIKKGRPKGSKNGAKLE